jgi:hypothetical protein
VRNQPDAKHRVAVAVAATAVVAAAIAAIAAIATTGATATAVVAAAVAAAALVALVAVVVYLRDSGARGAGGQGGMFRSLRGLLSGVLRRTAWGGVDPTAAGLMVGAGWRLMRVAACMMPAAARRRWLAEAESFLVEAPPVLRRGAVGSYLAGAPQVIVVSWAARLARRARGILSGWVSR